MNFKKVKKAFAGILTGAMVLAMGTLGFADDLDFEFEPLGYDQEGENTALGTIKLGEKVTAKVRPAAEKSFPVVPSAAFTVMDENVKSVSVDVSFTGAVAFNDWCGQALVVATPLDGSYKVYGFGGKQVGWNASINEDGDKVVPMAGEDGYFTLEDDGTGSFMVPVKNGDIIIIYDFCYSDNAEDLAVDHMEISLTGLDKVPNDANDAGDAAPFAALAAVAVLGLGVMAVSRKRA